MTCQQINTVTTPRIPESTTPTTKQNIEPPESLEEQENLIRRTNYEGDQINNPYGQDKTSGEAIMRSEEIEIDGSSPYRTYQTPEINNNSKGSEEPLCKTCREGKCVNVQGDRFNNKNCEDSEIRGRNYCKLYGIQEDLCPSCCKEINRQFDEILMQNGIPGDSHLEELGNAFETLYMDHVNNETKTG